MPWRVDDIVKSPAFGYGRVLWRDTQYLWVYFPELPDGPDVAVKKLSADAAILELAPEASDPRLKYPLPFNVVDGVIKWPKVARLSQRQAVELFLSKYPNAFADPALARSELDYKRQACALYQSLFGEERAQTLLDAGNLEAVATAVAQLFQATNIPSRFEMFAIRDGVKDLDATDTMLRGLLAFLHEPCEDSFSVLADGFARLPAQEGKTAPLKWPNVTLLPFLARPDRFIVVKPAMMRLAAGRLFFDLAYDSSPNWTTFDRILEFSEYLRQSLEPLGAKDMIDVHSFIWVTAGEPMMTKATLDR